MLKKLVKQPITFFTLSGVLALIDLGGLGLLATVQGSTFWPFFFVHMLLMTFMSGYFLGVDHTELKYKEMVAELLDRIPEEEVEDELHL